MSPDWEASADKFPSQQFDGNLLMKAVVNAETCQGKEETRIFLSEQKKIRAFIYCAAPSWTLTFSALLGRLPLLSPVFLVQFSLQPIMMHKLNNSSVLGDNWGPLRGGCQWSAIVHVNRFITSIMVDMKKLRFEEETAGTKWDDVKALRSQSSRAGSCKRVAR